MRPAFFVIMFLCIGCSSRDEGNRHVFPQTSDEAIKIAAHGASILNAIYRFHHVNGVWPMDLNELDGSGYKEWIFETRYDGYWTLTNICGFPNAMVRYKHSGLPDGDQWELSLGGFESPIELAYKPPVFLAIDSSEVAEKFNAIVRKRISAKPRQAIHYKGAISRFYELRELDLARDLCCDCLKQWPDLWWPNTVLCFIDIERGKPKEATDRLVVWAKSHDDFQHWFMAALAYDKAGMEGQSLAALRKAAVSDLNDINVKFQDTSENFGSCGATKSAYYAALLAYQKNKGEACLEICASWERFIKEKRTHGTPGFLVFQAACYLNMKELSKAKSAIDRAIRPPPPNFGYHLDTEIARLHKAIEAGDTSYHFEPAKLDAAKMPVTWEWLLKYE